MPSIQPAHLELLKSKLKIAYVPHLLPTLYTNRLQADIDTRNLSRAFSAFVLHHLCGISPQVAAQAVVDGTNDKGLDAIYYASSSETLYLVQTKLQASEPFKQEDALAFCQGIRKLIRQDFTGFNQHVLRRQLDIEEAVSTCTKVQLVIAHVGNGISESAKSVIQELLTDHNHRYDCFCDNFIDYDAQRVVADLQQSEAPQPVDATVFIANYEAVSIPRSTHFGLINLTDLVDLYNTYGLRLYEKNIRTFLGKKTGVNTAIRQTLADNPANFFYLNNGITALSYHIIPRGTTQPKRLDVKSFSIVNGAQTITSAAQFLKENPTADISAAQVAITIIEVEPTDDFSKAITQARNHQNQVSIADFAALDDEQERLRRDLAQLTVRYLYKPGTDTTLNANTIRIDEVAYALALFQPDPRFVVLLKRESSRLLTPQSEEYKKLFSPALTAQQVINAVRFRRYMQERVASEVSAATGDEKRTYQHGEHALGWLLAQQIRQQQSGHLLIDKNKLRSVLSQPFDTLRQLLWNETYPIVNGTGPGPLALFRNQTDVVQLLERVTIKAYALTNEATLNAKRQQQNPTDPYPVELFKYITDKAPQIDNLT